MPAPEREPVGPGVAECGRKPGTHAPRGHRRGGRLWGNIFAQWAATDPFPMPRYRFGARDEVRAIGLGFGGTYPVVGVADSSRCTLESSMTATFSSRTSFNIA